MNNEDLELLAEINGLSYAILNRAHTHTKTTQAGKYQGKSSTTKITPTHTSHGTRITILR